MSALYAEPAFSRLPKAKIWRRLAASAIDFIPAWLLSSIAMSYTQPGLQVGQWFVFLLVWLILRVVVVSKNQGQSLGHWALDMKVVDTKRDRLPGLKELAQRESIVGVEALLLLIALTNFDLGLVIFLLPIPIVIDSAIAISDPLRRQTFHDRLARTFVIHTFRGYSLDLKLRKLLTKVRRRVR